MAEVRCIRCLVDPNGGDVVHDVIYIVDGDAICEAHALEVVETPGDGQYLGWAAAQTWSFVSYNQYTFTFEAKDTDGVRGTASLATQSAGDLYRVDVGVSMTWFDLVEQGEPELRIIDAKGLLIYSNT